MPSGLEANSGQVLGKAPSCQLTVTIGLPKWGLYLEPGRSLAGKVEVVDIGFPKKLSEDPDKKSLIVDKKLAASLLPIRAQNAYKGTFGTVWVIGGSRHYLGAPLLSSQAALRSGAGLVLLAAPSSLCCQIGAYYPEIMRCPLEDEGFLNEDDLAHFPWLNTTFLDEQFRLFSGHTQVNATDLRNLPYPKKPQLIEMGKQLEKYKVWNQQLFDSIAKESINEKRKAVNF